MTPSAERPGGPPGIDAQGVADRAEAMIRAARAAVVTCPRCEAICPEPGARFCSSCGSRLTPQRSEAR